MRCSAIFLGVALLAAGACRRDPWADAMAAPRPPSQPPRVAVVGDTIAIAMVLQDVRAVAIVAPDGTVQAPLCGPVLVAGREAGPACAAVAQCLSTYYRSAAVQLTIGEPSAEEAAHEGCHAQGPARPEGWSAPSQRALAVLSRAGDHDPLVLARVAEAAAELEALRVPYTDAHPRVAAAGARTDRLATAAAASPREADAGGRLRNRLDVLLAEAGARVEQLAGEVGPKHPELLTALARRDLLAAAAAAFPDAPAAMPAAERAVLLVEAQARIEAMRADADPADPALLALQRQRSALQPTEDPRAIACTELVAAFDLHIARLQGARTSATDQGTTLDLVLDALAVARTDALLGKSCTKTLLGRAASHSVASTGATSSAQSSPPT